MSLVGNLMSWSVAIGFVLGFAANRVFHVARAFWLDKHRPLPAGKRSKWQALAVDPRAFAAVVMVCAVSWSVYKTQDNAHVSAQIAADAKDFAESTRNCQAQLIASQTGSRQVTADYNAEAEKQRQAVVDWLLRIALPPPDVASIPTYSEKRRAYTEAVTAVYLREIQRSQAEQAETVARRPALPSVNCN